MYARFPPQEGLDGANHQKNRLCRGPLTPLADRVLSYSTQQFSY